MDLTLLTNLPYGQQIIKGFLLYLDIKGYREITGNMIRAPHSTNRHVHLNDIDVIWLPTI